MVKTANLHARIEPKLKTEAETILSGLGVPVSNAFNMFYRQIVLHRGFPLPCSSRQSVSRMPRQ